MVRLSAYELHPVKHTLRRSERSAVFPASIAMMDKPFIDVRVYLSVNGPLYYPIPESKRHYKPRLRIADIKLSVIAHRITAIQQFVSDRVKVFFEPKAKSDDLSAVSLILRRLFIGEQKIIPRTDAVFKIPQLLHRRPLRSAARGVSAWRRLFFSPAGKARLADKAANSHSLSPFRALRSDSLRTSCERKDFHLPACWPEGDAPLP